MNNEVSTYEIGNKQQPQLMHSITEQNHIYGPAIDTNMHTKKCTIIYNTQFDILMPKSPKRFQIVYVNAPTPDHTKSEYPMDIDRSCFGVFFSFVLLLFFSRFATVSE